MLWLHPDVDRNHVYAALRDDVTTYQVLHVGTLFFIGLIGLALYLLVRDLPGRATRVSRLAVGPFVLLYGAWGGRHRTGDRGAGPARQRRPG